MAWAMAAEKLMDHRSVVARLIHNPPMDPANTKTEALAPGARTTRMVNAVKLGTPSFRVLSRFSRAIQFRC
jgi:hypothetical protein